MKEYAKIKITDSEQITITHFAVAKISEKSKVQIGTTNEGNYFISIIGNGQQHLHVRPETLCVLTDLFHFYIKEQNIKADIQAELFISE